MTRAEYQRACGLADQIKARLHKNSLTYALISELRELIETPPTMQEIVLSVDAPSHKQRAMRIGLSRQAYYNLLQGMARPSILTVNRLAELTGLPAETIKEVW